MTQRTHAPRACKQCSAEFIPGSGRALYCSTACRYEADRVDRKCITCGEDFRTRRRDGQFCSEQCRPRRQVSRLPTGHPVRILIRENATRTWQQRSNLRLAVESGNHGAVIDAVRGWTLDVGGCWIWQRTLNKDGYPTIKVAKRTVLVHRLVLEAKHGAPLGTQAAHHMCSRTSCINPAHLQPVTARENTAEMLARTYMVQRIAALEGALAKYAPHHPLLLEVGGGRHLRVSPSRV